MKPPNTSPLPPCSAWRDERRAFVSGCVRLAALPVASTFAAAAVATEPTRLLVGASREIKTLAEAARLVRGSTIIEVDAGIYPADVAVWHNVDVTVRAPSGRAILRAEGAAAEGKGIWVVRSSRVEVEGLDFIGARVPGANGAGIRFESGSLAVRDCAFGSNENGILTGNDRQAVLDIENSEFGYNGHGDGMSHNLYVGTIASLRVQGSWFHHARQGHLLKSRAGRNVIVYNRLDDGLGGQASYELEFPSGGVAIVMGNLIQQAATTENPHVVSYGTERLDWPDNELYLVNNTLVDGRAAGGVLLRAHPGTAVLRVVNNLFTGGNASLPNAAVGGEFSHNHRATPADLTVDGDGIVRLRSGSPLAHKASTQAGHAHGQRLLPSLEYAHPRRTRKRAESALSPGAFVPLAAPKR